MEKQQIRQKLIVKLTTYFSYFDDFRRGIEDTEKEHQGMPHLRRVNSELQMRENAFLHIDDIFRLVLIGCDISVLFGVLLAIVLFGAFPENFSYF